MPTQFAKKSSYRIKRNAPKRKSANPKNLKKTTARGAYKKGAKRNFRVRREPFVETKSLDTDTLMIETGIVGNETAHGVRNTLLPLELQNASAFNMQHVSAIAKHTHSKSITAQIKVCVNGNDTNTSYV